MTSLRPAPRPRDGGRAQVRALIDTDRRALRRLVEDDPLVNAVLAARLESARSLLPSRFGGMLYGCLDPTRPGDDLAAALFVGGNLLTVGSPAATPAMWAALAGEATRRPRSATSLAGRAADVGAVWRVLEPYWGRARDERFAQPLLVTGEAPDVDTDPRLCAVEHDRIEEYLPAAAAMFTEELGVSPVAGFQAASYRRRIEATIANRRAFAVFGPDGRVEFKADLGAVTDTTCQVQGVWVRPDLRGRGLGTAGLAGVVRHALTLAPTVSLYVNDFNLPARRVYDRLGFREVVTLATVLF